MDFRVKLLPLIVGGAMFFFGWQEWRLGTKAKAEPQVMTAADLSARGPGANLHVVLTHFIPAEGGYVYQAQKGGGGAAIGKWRKVWVPLLADASQFFRPGGVPNGNDLRILLKSTHVGDETELENLVRRPQLQGLVINEIESVRGEERKLLTETYPGVDFNRCYIFEVDRSPAGLGKVLGLLGGGGTLALLGAAWLSARGQR